MRKVLAFLTLTVLAVASSTGLAGAVETETLPNVRPEMRLECYFDAIEAGPVATHDLVDAAGGAHGTITLWRSELCDAAWLTTGGAGAAGGFDAFVWNPGHDAEWLSSDWPGSAPVPADEGMQFCYGGHIYDEAGNWMAWQFAGCFETVPLDPA